MEALDTLAYQQRELFEYWGHAACLLPVALYRQTSGGLVGLVGNGQWKGDA